VESGAGPNPPQVPYNSFKYHRLHDVYPVLPTCRSTSRNPARSYSRRASAIGSDVSK